MNLWPGGHLKVNPGTLTLAILYIEFRELIRLLGLAGSFKSWQSGWEGYA
jgi:hypothetical protein